MENVLSVIPAWIMLTIGVALLGVELLLGSFIVLFFGIAFIAVGVSGFFFEWSSGELQLLTTMLLGGLLSFVMRGFVMQGTSKEDLPLETMQGGDSGEIVADGGSLRVMYKGTTWKFKTLDGSEVFAGEEVLVEHLKNNVAHIKKLDKEA